MLFIQRSFGPQCLGAWLRKSWTRGVAQATSAFVFKITVANTLDPATRGFVQLRSVAAAADAEHP